jgi:hypothetical protein
VVVNFTGALHLSTLDAGWLDGAPTAQIIEFP